jgi:hypothetical protein
LPVWSVMNMALATDANARASSACAAGCGEVSAAGFVMAGIATEGITMGLRSLNGRCECHI